MEDQNKKVPKTPKNILKLHKEKISCDLCGKIVNKYKLKNHQMTKLCVHQRKNFVQPNFKQEQDEVVAGQQPEQKLIPVEELQLDQYLNDLIEKRLNEIKTLQEMKKLNKQ